MIPIAFAFTITALWLILSPWHLSTTLWVIVFAAIILSAITLYSLIKSRYLILASSCFILIGMMLSTSLYLPALKDYQHLSLNIPTTLKATFKIEQNQYSTSITIKILTAHSTDQDNDKPEKFYAALQESTLQVFDIDPEVKSYFVEGEIYQGTLSIRPRYYRNIPGDRQRIYQALARKSLGYGKFEGKIQKITTPSWVDDFRQQTALHFKQRFQYGSYLSALSVGITRYLTTEDWDRLRKTGTIHLVSISGLHLSLTAFYAFMIFRVIAGLLAIKKIQPYKIAAFLAIIVAWYYALVAGLSLPTIRAAIMFSLAMLALLINRPIFSLQGVSIALLIILIHHPLSILLPGFWLSFMAVTILILCVRIFPSPLKALLFTQLIISLLLIPLTASFFGEISLISPLINLFAIPWTFIMIMPFVLLGMLLLQIHAPTASFLIAIADQSIAVLTKGIEWSSQMPYASIQTARLSLILAITLTTGALVILYLIPRSALFRTSDFGARFFQKCHDLCDYLPYRRIFIMSVLLLMISFSLTRLFSHQNSKPAQEIINLYLLPVGEGLSLLFQSSQITFLFDTGNRFMNFDAGQQVILPTLKQLNIETLDQIFLSLQNQQHIGGTRSVRTQFPETAITAHPDLHSLIEGAQDCRQYEYDSQIIKIRPIPQIYSSCALQIVLFERIFLYLFSDITPQEWQYFLNQETALKPQNFDHTILLFPNQGRRHFSLNNIFPATNTFNTILFSTKRPVLQLMTSLQNHPQTRIYNAYYGTIHLQIDTKNAKPLSKLRIENYADDVRYWWLQP